jgi:hypothetical protein
MELRERIFAFQQITASKLAALYSEGLVTPRDRMKLESEVQGTAGALLESLQSTQYYETFKEEWLWRIELSYQERIRKHISEIESRRYSDKAIAVRVNQIVQSTMSRLERVELSRQRIALQVEANRLIKGLQSDIRGISRSHSRRSELIATWIQEFEQKMQALARSNLEVIPFPDSLR